MTEQTLTRIGEAAYRRELSGWIDWLRSIADPQLPEDMGEFRKWTKILINIMGKAPGAPVWVCLKRAIARGLLPPEADEIEPRVYIDLIVEQALDSMVREVEEAEECRAYIARMRPEQQAESDAINEYARTHGKASVTVGRMLHRGELSFDETALIEADSGQ